MKVVAAVMLLMRLLIMAAVMAALFRFAPGAISSLRRGHLCLARLLDAQLVPKDSLGAEQEGGKEKEEQRKDQPAVHSRRCLGSGPIILKSPF